jgi:hypothetical protein
MKSFCAPRQILWNDQLKGDEAGGYKGRVGETGNAYIKFWSENLKQRGRFRAANVRRGQA